MGKISLFLGEKVRNLINLLILVYYYQQKSLNYHTTVVLGAILVEFPSVLLVELLPGLTLVELVLLLGVGVGFLLII